MSNVLTRIYYTASLISSAFATLCITMSFMSSNWETITYDMEAVQAAAKAIPEIQVNVAMSPKTSRDDYFTVIRLSDLPSFWRNGTLFERTTDSTNLHTTTPVVNNIIYEHNIGSVVVNIPAILHIPINNLGSLWQTCDALTDDAREFLTNHEGSIYPKCKSYIDFRAEELYRFPHLDLLMSLSRSAVACAIVSLISVLVAIPLGSFAAIRRQIIFAMITGVCFFAAGIYAFFTVTLILLRRTQIESDTHYLPAVAVAGRVVQSSWSTYTGWATCFLCNAAGSSWILLAMELKNTRMIYMYSSSYDQICSM